MVYKSLNDLVPGYLSSKLVEQYETCYSLRDSVKKLIFIVPFPQTNFMNNSFSYSGVVLWNSLPYDMREAKSLSQFKRLAHLNFCLRRRRSKPWRVRGPAATQATEFLKNKEFFSFLFFLNHRGSFYGGGDETKFTPPPPTLCIYMYPASWKFAPVI